MGRPGGVAHPESWGRTQGHTNDRWGDWGRKWGRRPQGCDRCSRLERRPTAGRFQPTRERRWCHQVDGGASSGTALARDCLPMEATEKQVESMCFPSCTCLCYISKRSITTQYKYPKPLTVFISITVKLGRTFTFSVICFFDI